MECIYLYYLNNRNYLIYFYVCIYEEYELYIILD